MVIELLADLDITEIPDIVELELSDQNLTECPDLSTYINLVKLDIGYNNIREFSANILPT